MPPPLASFSSLGRFGQYGPVPGNTPTGVLVAALGSIPSLCFTEDQQARARALSQGRGLEGDEDPRAAGSALDLTHGGARSAALDSIQGRRTLLECDPAFTCDLALAIDALVSRREGMVLSVDQHFCCSFALTGSFLCPSRPPPPLPVDASHLPQSDASARLRGIVPPHALLQHREAGADGGASIVDAFPCRARRLTWFPAAAAASDCDHSDEAAVTAAKKVGQEDGFWEIALGPAAVAPAADAPPADAPAVVRARRVLMVTGRVPKVRKPPLAGPPFSIVLLCAQFY